MQRRVQIVDLQQIYRGVKALYVPLIHGLLRAHAEQFEDLIAAYMWLEPLCVPDRTDRLLEQMDAPDVVGVSTYLWNERNSLALARAVKDRWPQCLVVFGGPQVPRAPSDYLARNPQIDLLVHGEGEAAFSGILRECLEPAPDWRRVPGCSWLEGDQQIFSAPGQRLEPLDLPSPFLRGWFDEFVARGRAAGFNIVASLETSRGCPYGCAFCGWGMATRTKPRFFDETRVRAELDWVARQRIAMLFLIDANFGIAERDVGLLRHVADLKAREGFPQATVISGFSKNNKTRTFTLTRILQDSGLDEGITVNFSLQTQSDVTLDAIDRSNIPLEGYRALSDDYARHGYTLTPDLIFPLPGETLDSFTAGYADLASWPHVNRIRVYPSIILPNTPMSEPAYRARWGLETRYEPLRLPLLEPIVEGLHDEQVETVTHTALISPADAVQARVFVAVVNAFEVYGLTRTLRRGLQRLHGIDTRTFYMRLIAWHRQQGPLARVIADAEESFAAGAEHGEELGWSGRARTRDGEWLMPVKALTFDALVDADAFEADLCAFVAKGLGLPVTAVERDLVAFQAAAWIRPDYDPSRDEIFSCAYDWPAWSSDAPDAAKAPDPADTQTPPLPARPIRFSHAPRESVIRFGYTPSREQWTLHFLAPWQHDTLCCHLPAQRRTWQDPA